MFFIENGPIGELVRVQNLLSYIRLWSETVSKRSLKTCINLFWIIKNVYKFNFPLFRYSDVVSEHYIIVSGNIL